MKTLVHIESVSQVHQMLGDEPPSIFLLRSSPRAPLTPQVQVLDVSFVSALYTVSLKQGNECELKYGREHIHFHLIERGKSLLLGSNETVERIAYALGFEYPQHFSKLFKSHTGRSPAEYRR